MQWSTYLKIKDSFHLCLGNLDQLGSNLELDVPVEQGVVWKCESLEVEETGLDVFLSINAHF